MKKFFLFALIALAFFSGCKKNNEEPDPEPNFSDLVIGKWINTQVDGMSVLTDESFYINFRSDHVQIFSDMVVTDEQNKIWVEDDLCTYSTSGKVITIESSGIAPYSKHLELLVSEISQTSMTYTVQKFLFNGVEIVDNKSYTLQRITTDLKTQLQGIWQGHETTPGVVSTHDNYWEYFSDGTYNYYYFDEETNMYVNKEDNNGTYFVYGNFLASNFMNNITIGEEGQDSECWNFSFEGDSMFWTGLREGGVVKSFSMKKVANPPVVDYQQAILGTWVNTKINNVTIFSDDAYIFRFDPTMVEMFAKGYVLDGDNTKWIESNNYVYVIENDIVTVDGIDADGISAHIEMEIQAISETSMTYTVEKMVLNGIEIEDNNTYFMVKAAEDYSSEIIGIWKGKETTPGTNQMYDMYLKFFEDGSYSYYFMNEETGNYEVLEDGRFFLYGDLFVENYDTDPNTTDGLKYHCRNIIIDDNSLEFTYLRNDGVLQTFLFERTDTPPML